MNWTIARIWYSNKNRRYHSLALNHQNLNDIRNIAVYGFAQTLALRILSLIPLPACAYGVR